MFEYNYLDIQIIDEYYRCKRSIQEKQDFIERELIKGYLSCKNIKNSPRYYLQWREGSKIRSVYISYKDLDNVKELIRQRKELEKEIRLLKANIRKIEKLYSKEQLNEARTKLTISYKNGDELDER